MEHQTILAKYEAIWDRYKKQYESKAKAKELTKIKKDTMQYKEECKKLSNQQLLAVIIEILKVHLTGKIPFSLIDFILKVV